MRARRWRRTRWGRTWTWGWRSWEWWVGVRYDFPTDSWEWNLLGLTLMVGRD